MCQGCQCACEKIVYVACPHCGEPIEQDKKCPYCKAGRIYDNQGTPRIITR